jgi:hypothetical protein
LRNSEGRITQRNKAVLIGLDDDQNSVLPFGFLDSAKPWSDIQDTASKQTGPLSLEIGSHAALGNGVLKNWPDRNGMAEKRFFPLLGINWDPMAKC